MLTVSNHGPLITSTNFWGSDHEQAGKVFCSVNAGAIRLLLPRSLANLIGEWRTSKYVILSRGPWPAERQTDAAELLFEDGSDAPFSIHLTPNSFDALPAEPPAGQEWVLSAWVLKKDKPHKALERPCKWRRSNGLPDLSPWSD